MVSFGKNRLELMNNFSIIIRQFHSEDVEDICHLYYDTVHSINRRDYIHEQVNAWAPYRNNYSEWGEKLDRTQPLVATICDEIVGFAELENNGHIDCFYVHKDYQKIGVGTKLLNAINQRANSSRMSRLYAEVSITAKTFFEKHNFKLLSKQSVVVRSVELTNFLMEKILPMK
jgi:putative acetyltransferase